jgi:hypothetical protein
MLIAATAGSRRTRAQRRGKAREETEQERVFIGVKNNASGELVAAGNGRMLVHSFPGQACGYPEHRRLNALMRNAFHPAYEIRALLRVPF